MPHPLRSARRRKAAADVVVGTSLLDWNAARRGERYTEWSNPDLLSAVGQPLPPDDPWSPETTARVQEEAARLASRGVLDPETIALLDRTIDGWLDQWARRTAARAEQGLRDALGLVAVHRHNAARAAGEHEAAAARVTDAGGDLLRILVAGGLQPMPPAAAAPPLDQRAGRLAGIVGAAYPLARIAAREEDGR